MNSHPMSCTPHGHPAEQSLDDRPLVLVVHRSPTVRQALLVTLDLDGFDVLVAADGAEASALLLEMRPRFVIADLAASDEHLDDFLRRLRSDVKTACIPVIDFGRNMRVASGAPAQVDSLTWLLDRVHRVVHDTRSTPDQHVA
jgi:PleD family two-component response regulator